MALNIKIDFEDRYHVYAVDDLNFSIFDSALINGGTARLGIKISFDEHPLMMDVFNLAFGPVNIENQIDDQAKLRHQDYSKVFSTIVFEGLSFLTKNPNKFLGIDGSSTAKAYMYYRVIQKNFDYLNAYFDIYGVNYYVRILRDGANDHDDDDFLTVPKLIRKGEVIKPGKLYNYFVFRAK
jgi:hypothetical protein